MKLLNTRYLAGILVLLLGLILLSNNLGFTDVRIGYLLRIYWPVVLIAWGLNILVFFFKDLTQESEGRGGAFRGQLTSGLLILIIGLLYLGGNLGLYKVNFSFFWRLFWPVILILFGITLLKSRAVESGRSQWSFMGGIDIGKNPFNLKGGNYVAFLGGIDLDLTKANISEGETVLDLTAVMGGIDVKVPKDLNISCEGTAFLGGIEFLNDSTGGIISSKKMESCVNEQARAVHFQTRTLMGGISIKRV